MIVYSATARRSAINGGHVYRPCRSRNAPKTKPGEGVTPAPRQRSI